MTIRCDKCGNDVDDGIGLIAILTAASFGGLVFYCLIQLWSLFF